MTSGGALVTAAGRLLGPGGAAAHLGVSPSTLRGLHARGRGPRCQVVAGRRVYTVAELDRWDREDRRPAGRPRRRAS